MGLRQWAIMAAIGVVMLILYLIEPGQNDRGIKTEPELAFVDPVVSTVSVHLLQDPEKPAELVNSDSTVPEDCQKKNVSEKSPENLEEYKAQVQTLAAELNGSDDAEHLLAAALLGGFGTPGAQLALLNEASRMAPSDALVAWNRLKVCRELNGATCDLREIETNALQVDGDNGAVWMEVAMLRLGEGRHNVAAEAVRRAIAAPRFDNYFIDHAVVIERALAIRGDRSYAERVFMGIGVAAASSVSYYRMTTECEALAGDGGVWLELCDQLGARMSVEENTILDQAIGRAIRKIAAAQSGDEERIEKLTTDYEAFRSFYGGLLNDRSRQYLLENDEILLRQYVENLSTYGELEAQVRLKADAQRLLNDPDYDQCNFVSAWESQ